MDDFMKNILPGLKTKISSWTLALAPVAAMLGYNIEPEAVGKFLDDFQVWIASGSLLIGAAAHYFRNLANK